MASLTDVYEGHVRTVTTPRRRYAGASGFAVGAAMVVGGILVATTGLGETAGLNVVEARRVAGILAGLGLPLSFLGVFAVLPSGATTRAAAVIGASVSAFGVALFGVAYPGQWFAAGDPLAVVTVAVYFAGGVTTLFCLFAGLATFKTRTDPGGTARMEITEEGAVRVVEDTTVVGTGASSASTGNSNAGVNRYSAQVQDESEDDAEILNRDHASYDDVTHPAQQATADGGATVDDGAGGAEVLGDPQTEPRGQPDAYCGNCKHFEYVKVDETITPYCGLHEELMEDMDACSEWTESS
jgi:cytochrome c biogenesis protein CcdA